MDVQNLLFPKAGICFEQQLYYHKNDEKIRLDTESCSIIFENRGSVEFDTYFNSFSIEKWKKYTILELLGIRLSLKGKFRVTLKNKELVNHNVVEYILGTYPSEAEEATDFEFDFSGFDQKGIYCFQLEALEDGSVFYGGAYCSDIDKTVLPEVNVAINMCTYRREKYVYRSAEILNRNILHNENSPLNGHLQLYITDNGRSLDVQKVQSELIHVFPQADTGGAGGFTRGLIEVLRDKDKKNITHVIMMDDDVLIEPESIVRTYIFLRLLKEEYRDAFIGGGLLRSDYQHVQYISGGQWDFDRYYIMLKCGLDLRSCVNVLNNEIDEGAKINGWWYHCLPVSAISETNLPFPMFFHMDDVEYDIRNCKKLILLNGICVWHEPFEYKPGSYQAYYNTRNVAISNVIHYQTFNKRRMKHFISVSVFAQLLTYKYKDAMLVLRGAEDFFKGIDWLVSQDPEEFLDEIIASGYKKEPLEDLPIRLDYSEYLNGLVNKESKLKKRMRKLLLNGYYLPANRTVIVPMFGPMIRSFYRAKRVLNYDVISSKAYVTEKSYKELFRAFIRYAKLMHLVNKKFDSVAQEYRSRWNEVTNLSFWKKYLHIENE